MSDSFMCKNEACHLRKFCYRFNATPDKHAQSYSDYKPNDEGKCDGFIKMTSQKPKAFVVKKVRVT